jgi:glycosyltransferase involved in cell wall biosynthesis
VKTSIVMTVYNGAWCIEGALDSVMAQTRRPEEILICDDGSTDGTPELVERRYGSAVTLLRLPHRGAAITRRAGLDRSTGDWIAFMDADDTWVPEKHQRQLECIAAHPEARLITSDGSYISAAGLLRESWLSDYFHPVREISGDLFPALVERCWVLLSATLVERSAYEAVGRLDPNVTFSYDYDLWLRVLARFPGVLMTDRLTTYFSSPGAMSRNIEARYRDDLMLLRRVESGEVGGHRPAVMRRAAERAAALEYDLGLMCLRSQRIAEGRERMRRATGHGPLQRRLFATAGALVPEWAMRPLMQSSWLKSTVQRSRQPVERIEADGETRGAA